MKKLAVSFKGGFSNGLGSIGVARFLQENNITPEICAGASSGSMVAAAYALGYKWNEMVEMFSQIKMRRYFSIPSLIFGGSLISKKQFEKVFIQFSKLQDPNLKIEDMDKKFIAFASDRKTKQRVYITSGKLVNAIMASTNLPILFPLGRGKYKNLVDGDLTVNYSTKYLKDHGADIVLGSGFKKGTTDPNFKSNLLAALQDSYNILERQIDEYADKYEPPDIEIEYEVHNHSPIDFDVRKLVLEVYKQCKSREKEIFELIN